MGEKKLKLSSQVIKLSIRITKLCAWITKWNLRTNRLCTQIVKLSNLCVRIT